MEVVIMFGKTLWIWRGFGTFDLNYFEISTQNLDANAVDIIMNKA